MSITVEKYRWEAHQALVLAHLMIVQYVHPIIATRHQHIILQHYVGILVLRKGICQWQERTNFLG